MEEHQENDTALKEYILRTSQEYTLKEYMPLPRSTFYLGGAHLATVVKPANMASVTRPMVPGSWYSSTSLRLRHKKNADTVINDLHCLHDTAVQPYSCTEKITPFSLSQD